MKILIIGVEPYSIYNFRGCLIKSLIKNGCEVVAAGYKASNSQKIKINSLGCKYIEYDVNRVWIKSNKRIKNTIPLYHHVQR